MVASGGDIFRYWRDLWDRTAAGEGFTVSHRVLGDPANPPSTHPLILTEIDFPPFKEYLQKNQFEVQRHTGWGYDFWARYIWGELLIPAKQFIPTSQFGIITYAFDPKTTIYTGSYVDAVHVHSWMVPMTHIHLEMKVAEAIPINHIIGSAAYEMGKLNKYCKALLG